MKKADLSYIAGFFDGEGSIIIIKGKSYELRCSVVNTNQWIMELFRFYFGGGITVSGPDKKHPHAIYDWHIYARKATEFLRVILPYLKLKKAEAELGIKFQKGIQVSLYKGGSGHRMPTTVKVLREADRILMQELKKRVKGEPKSDQDIQQKEIVDNQLALF